MQANLESNSNFQQMHFQKQFPKHFLALGPHLLVWGGPGVKPPGNLRERAAQVPTNRRVPFLRRTAQLAAQPAPFSLAAPGEARFARAGPWRPLPRGTWARMGRLGSLPRGRSGPEGRPEVLRTTAQAFAQSASSPRAAPKMAPVPPPRGESALGGPLAVLAEPVERCTTPDLRGSTEPRRPPTESTRRTPPFPRPIRPPRPAPPPPRTPPLRLHHPRFRRVRRGPEWRGQ